MGVSKFNVVQADSFMGSIYEASPFGKIWYVDGTNGSDGNSGDGPNAGECLATIGQAITNAVASRGDTVVIYPGTYTITSALAPLAHMTFRAAIVNPQTPSVSIRGNIASLVTVDVSGVRFIGIEFRATGSSTSGATNRQLVKLADTTAITGGVTFEDCVFHGADANPGATGLVGISGIGGIWAADASNAVTGLVVRRCLFRDLGKTPLWSGVQGLPYWKIEDNVFAIDTPGGMGINIADTTALATGKGYVIRQNEFIGPNTSTPSNIGIVIAGTQDLTAVGMIRNNFFSYCAAASITRDKVPQAVINNYVGDNAGGVLVDSSATS